MLQAELEAWQRCLPERLRLAREDAGLDSEGMARLLETTTERIRALETGKAFPDLPTLDRLGKVTGWNRDGLLRCRRPLGPSWTVLVCPPPKSDQELEALLWQLNCASGERAAG